jgi:hypothetical protein
MVTALHIEPLTRLCARALAGGGRKTGPTTVEWDISGGCVSPIVREFHSRGDVDHGPTMGRHMLRCIMTLKCRQCAHCKLVRRIAWTNRAQTEIIHSARTWFGTYTYRPEVRTLRTAAAILHMKRRWGDIWETQPENIRLRFLDQVMVRDFQLYFKRVRKKYSAQLRYMLVMEPHPSSGFPHYHALIHQVSAAQLTYRDLTEEWDLGFSTLKLVDTGPQAARYVAKYVGKGAYSRPRASQRYGQGVDTDRQISRPST